MAEIAKGKTRMMLTISEDMKATLTEQAKSENRSLNNLIITILMNYLADKDS